jgi:hypothetical protein
VSFSDLAAKLTEVEVPWWLLQLISWVLAMLAMVSGWDYTHIPDRAVTARSLTVVEQLWSMSIWGFLYYLSGSLLVLGLLIRRHVVVWLGHAMGVVLGVGFTIATTQGVIDFMSSTTAQSVGSFWRSIMYVLLPTILHGAVCVVLRPIPRLPIGGTSQ